MKTKLLTYTLLLTLFTVKHLHAQCTHQVTHTSGTTNVNGIDITATSFGYAEQLNICNYSEPYVIGWNGDDFPHGDGGYTYQFSPPVDSLNLNFSFINAENGTEEIIRIYLNGGHYMIPEVGASTSCSDSMAVITPAGDLAGPSSEHHYGGNVLVTGPIYELTVLDSFLVGQPLGVSFSLHICSEFTTSINDRVLSDVKVYPVPSGHAVTVEGVSSLQTEFQLFDVLGRQVYIDPTIQDSKAMFEIDHLANGIYYLTISLNGNSITRKVIVSKE